MRHDLNLLLRNDLLSFAKKAFSEMNAQRMPEDRYLELLASRLAEVVTGDSKRLIVNLPPRHFKSWIGSVCLSAWILGRDPSAKILVVTYGQELADKIAHTIRGIMRSEWYRVWPLCSTGSVVATVVGRIDHHGGGVLRRDAGGCFGSSRQAGYLQYRPGLAVHGRGLHQRARHQRHCGQHGR